MSKVLVERELLESLAELGEDAINRMGSYLAEKHGEQRYVDAARAILAQPAEAEGPGDWGWLKLAAEVAEEDGPWEPLLGMTDCETAFSQSASPTRVLELIAALSAVTAERDRLDADCGRLLEGKIQDAETIFVLEAERDQLRAEVEGMRKDAERYRWLKENVKHEFFGDQIVDLFTRSNQKIDRLVDAAMAAKEV